MHDVDPKSLQTTLELARLSDAPSLTSRLSVVAFGPSGTQSAELRPGQSLVVGRSFPAELQVDDASLSRQHARFIWHDDGSIEVEDLGSRNGTHVASEKVERKLLQAGERVVLGGVTCAVYRLEPRDAPSHSLGSYDELLTVLRAELVRARELQRSVALLAIRAVAGTDAAARHVGSWAPRLAKALRPIDRAAVYDGESVLVLLVERDAEAARAVAEAWLEGAAPRATLRAGIAVYPASAGTHEKLVAVAQEALREATSAAPVHAHKPPSAPPVAVAEGLIVRSRSTLELHELVRRVAERSIAAVLVQGETGTGKELIASAIHTHSARAKGPLRVINCAAIAPTLTESVLFGHERGAFTGAHQSVKGIFEEAHGGTLFLDEIGDLNLGAQAALLRVLETRRITRVGSQREIEVDVRIVAATHRDLDAMAERGEFRSDLLYRLNAITLHVPPLRERREEIAPLAEHFVRVIARAHQAPAPALAEDALEHLVTYGWPGNVRELRNVIERALVVCRGDAITARDLTDRVRGGGSPAALGASLMPTAAGDELEPEQAAVDGSLRSKLKDYETKLILEALQATAGHQVKAAALLGLPVRTFVHKLKTLGIRHAYARE